MKIIDIKKILTNKIFLFLINRYFVFFIQFINFSIISIKLGVFNFGIWSFILLFLQYSNYSTLGTEYSLNILLSTKQRSKVFSSIIFSNGILILSAISILLIVLCIPIVYFDLEIFSKYLFISYLIPTVLIAIFWNFNNYYSNIYRVYGKLFEIAFFQTSIQVLLIPAILLFKSEQLLISLLYITAFAHIISLILFIYNSPLNFKYRFHKKISKIIIKRGLFLLFYNVSAYLMLLSSKTIVSIFYSVEEMGKFSFANSISQTAVMGFSIISFILFPKLIEKLNAKEKNSEAIFERAKTNYFYAAYFSILLVILVLPLFLHFFDQYKDSYKAIVYLLLAQIIAAISFAHAILLISNKNELQLGIIAIASVLVNILIGLAIKFIFHLNYEYIALGNIITAIIYTFLTTRKAKNFMSWSNSFSSETFKSEIILFLPFGLTLINCLTINSFFVNLTSLTLLILLKLTKIKMIVKEAKHLITDFKL